MLATSIKSQYQRLVLKAKVKKKQNPIKYKGSYSYNKFLVIIANISN